MKKLLSIVILLTVIPLAVYCQEEENEDKPFHFIELGVGAANTRQIHGDFNIALSNGMRKNIANFLDYNMAIGKSQVLFHEFSFKIGPYYQLSPYSYIAVSSGLSFMWNTPFVEYEYNRDYMFPRQVYSEDKYLINIPIQAKINIEVYKSGCIGFKGTYNKMMDKWVDDKWTVLMYVAMGF